jgi:hypothetical protein
MQGGSNADPILGEFFVKYVPLFKVCLEPTYIVGIIDSRSMPRLWESRPLTYTTLFSLMRRSNLRTGTFRVDKLKRGSSTVRFAIFCNTIRFTDLNVRFYSSGHVRSRRREHEAGLENR